MNRVFITIIIFLVLLLGGCGQDGPLYLPNNPPSTADQALPQAVPSNPGH